MFKKLALLASLGLTACNPAPEALLKQVDFSEDQIIATDSRLRVVSKSGIGISSIPGEVDPQHIYCVEPSPDVATAIANSFGAGANVLGYGNAAISSASVEGLVQLGERTATIQLFRDKMYQTCLAYANGAISGTTYSFIMSRLDDTIVTLLLGETAGGAFGRELASIGGEAKSSASAKMSALPGDIANLDQRIAATTAAEEELRTAEKNLAEHKAITPVPADKDTHDAQTVVLEDKVKAAEAKRDAAQRLMKDTLEAASDSAAEIASTGGGGLDVTPDPLIAATLADMQAEFLLQDVSSSIVTACLVELGRQFGRSPAASRATDKYLARVEITVAAKRVTGSALADFCNENLRAIIDASSERHAKFRDHKATHRAKVDIVKFGAQYAASAARANEALKEATTTCNLLEDAVQKKACLRKAFDLPPELVTQ